MCEYRFAGTVKVVELKGSQVIVKLVPDSEYTVVHKEVKRKKESKQNFAVFQPIGKHAGRAYAYDENLAFEVKCMKGASIPIGLHCELKIEDVSPVRGCLAEIRKIGGADNGTSFYVIRIK